MTPILLVHHDEADRGALEDWLVSQGHEVHSGTDLPVLLGTSRSSPTPPLVVCHEDAWPVGRDDSELVGRTALVLGIERPLSLPAGTVRLGEPCRLEELTAELDSMTRSLDAAESQVAEAEPPARDEDLPAHLRASMPISAQTMLLRGIAHTFNNPLAAASGWLQLLQFESQSLPPSCRRIIDQMGVEVSRMEKVAQALSIIGGRPGGLSVPFRPLDLLERARQQVKQEGLDIVMRVPQGESPVHRGDPSELDLLFDLLLTSYLEDRSMVGTLEVTVVATPRQLGITFEDEGAVLEVGPDPADLGLLLQRMRHLRAIALSLADALVKRRMGGDVRVIGSSLRPGARLELTMPLEAEATAQEEARQ